MRASSEPLIEEKKNMGKDDRKEKGSLTARTRRSSAQPKKKRSFREPGKLQIISLKKTK